MQLQKSTHVDTKKVEQILIRENKFISDFFSVLCIPKRSDENEDEEETHIRRKHGIPGKEATERATSLHELQDRLKAITSKKKLSYKEKLAKKSLKNRMKKKSKHDERNAQQKLLRAQKLTKPEKVEEEKTDEQESKTKKPVFNSEGKMVFSKFDFANLGKKKHKKQEKDPKKLLENLQKEKEKIKELTETGEVEKAIEIKEKSAWKNALAKAEGQKVKDDPTLLKKSLERKEQKHRASKKKWEMRQQNVEKAKEERQKKRADNIQKRKKDKKINKLKKAAKRGKIIPGF